MGQDEIQVTPEEFWAEALGCVYPIELLALAIIYMSFIYNYQSNILPSSICVGYIAPTLFIYIIALVIGKVTDFSGSPRVKIFIHILTFGAIIAGIFIIIDYNNKHTKLIIEEFTSSSNAQWYFPESDSGSTEFMNGKLRISIVESNTLMWARFLEESSIKDFDLTIRCNPQQDNVLYGIVFRAMDEKYLLFAISGNKFFILRNDSGDWLELSPTDSSNKISMDTNIIQLHVIGDNIQIKVNGEKLIDIEDLNMPPAGQIGLAVGALDTQATVEFDDLHIKLYDYIQP
jgi:hypothetical protein